MPHGAPDRFSLPRMRIDKSRGGSFAGGLSDGMGAKFDDLSDRCFYNPLSGVPLCLKAGYQDFWSYTPPDPGGDDRVLYLSYVPLFSRGASDELLLRCAPSVYEKTVNG